MSDLVCGRTTHPITLRLGGFSKVPTPGELADLRRRMEAAKPVVSEVAGLLASVKDYLTQSQRET